MTLRAYRTFQAFILGGLGLYLLSKVMDGRILLYINRRFVLLVLLGALGLVFLAQLVLRERPPVQEEETGQPDGHHHEHHTAGNWSLFLLALPLLIGLLVPERPLSAGAARSRGVNTTAWSGPAAGTVEDSLRLPPEQRSVLDWIRVAGADPDGVSYDGLPADITGFVYHDASLSPDQFLVGRFSIACCVADATAIGVVVTWPEAAALPENGWVRVQGTVTPSEVNGRTLPVIHASRVEQVPEPDQPYVFP